MKNITIILIFNLLIMLSITSFAKEIPSTNRMVDNILLIPTKNQLTLNYNYTKLNQQIIKQIIEQINNGKYSHLELYKTNIGDKELIELSNNAIANSKTIISINLYKNHVGDTAAIALFNAAQKNLTTKILYLSKNEITSQGLKVLPHKHSAIEILNLSNNNIDQKAGEILSAFLQQTNKLHKLDLYFNELGDVGVISLSKGLAANKSLKELDLACNNITDHGVKYLAKALEKNDSLIRLNLEHNEITDAGAEFLLSMLEKNHKITNLTIFNSRISDLYMHKLSLAIQKNQAINRSI